MEIGSVSRVKCPTCAKTCSHKILLSSGSIEHLRCSECGKVGVFAFEMVDGKGEGEKKKKRSSIDYAALMERRGSKKSNPYSIKKDYTDGDYLSHPKFGDGYVLTVLPPNKMKVLFADEKKLLICGPGSKSGKTKMTGQKKSPKNSKQTDTNAKKITTRKKVAAPSGDEPVDCPICGATVHPYNLSKDPEGQVVGCMNCSGR
jgi:hypothetical protein